MSYLTGDWQWIMRSSVSAEANDFFLLPLHYKLYLEVTKFHDLYNLFSVLKSICQTTTDKWFIYGQLPVICSHTLHPGKKKIVESSKRQDNELKSLCASVFCSKPSRREAITNEGKDSSHRQRNVSSLASAEWQRAKWAWPFRRGNIITVCQSGGSARDRLLLHFKMN